MPKHTTIREKVKTWTISPGANLHELITYRFDFNRISEAGYNTHNLSKTIGEDFRALNHFTSTYLRVVEDEETAERREVYEQTAYAKTRERWEAFEKSGNSSFSCLILFLDSLCDIYYAREFDRLAYKLEENDPKLSNYDLVLNHYAELLSELLLAQRGDLFEEEKKVKLIDLIYRLTSQKYLVRYNLMSKRREKANPKLKKRREDIEKLMIASIMKLRLDENSVDISGVDQYILSLSSSES